MKWAAWYKNDQFFTGTSIKEFGALPAEGVIGIKTWSEKHDGDIYYSKILTGDRWYFALEKIIVSETTKDMDELMLRYPEATHIKRGTWVQDEVMDRVQQAIMKLGYSDV